MTTEGSGPLSPHSAVPPGVTSLADYERLARRHLPAPIWNHVQEGAGAGRSVAENRAAFARWGFLPRALVDLRGGGTGVSLLGREHAAPLMLAPLAYQRLAHPDGELASVRAAVALDTGFILSTLASATIETVAQAAEDAARDLGMRLRPPLWFQLYLQPDRAHSLALVRRAEAAGYEAIVLTIDAAIKLSGITLPDGVEAANLAGMPRPRQTSVPGGRILFGTALADAAPRWEDLAWVRSETRLPILVKGMVLGDDARRAVAEGADGLILSNHGGRVLDGLPSALDVIAGVAEAVQAKVPLVLDGGVRTGTDVVKALALGASTVLVGRPVYHALAVAGMAGVVHAIHLLRVELEAAMAQLGCPTPQELKPERLIRLG